MLEKGSEGKISQSMEKESSSFSETVRFSVLSLGKSKSNQGWTPLHLAAYFGHKNVVQVLLEVCKLDNIKALL